VREFDAFPGTLDNKRLSQVQRAIDEEHEFITVVKTVLRRDRRGQLTRVQFFL
jgi:hypothetical protein